MKVLITSGGTKVPIDDVRNITNMSSGKFGSRIAREFLKREDEVTFLYAKNSITPFGPPLDFYNYSHNLNELVNLYIEYNLSRNLYSQTAFSTYEDYSRELFLLLEKHQFDAVVLAAAVSDYKILGTNTGKISSSNSLELKLEKLPKIISNVKDFSPKSKLIGFKLLVNSTHDQMIKSMEKSILENNCDMIVGNDLSDIRAGQRKINILTKDSSVSFSNKRYRLEECVVDSVYGLFK